MTTRPTAPRTNLPTRCSRLRAALSYSITRWLPRTNLRSRTTMCSSFHRRHRSALPPTRYDRQPPGADSSCLTFQPKISPFPRGWQQTAPKNLPAHPPSLRELATDQTPRAPTHGIPLPLSPLCAGHRLERPDLPLHVLPRLGLLPAAPTYDRAPSRRLATIPATVRCRLRGTEVP